MLFCIIMDVPVTQPPLDDVVFSVLSLAKAYLMLDRRHELRIYAASSSPIFERPARSGGDGSSSSSSTSTSKGDGDPTILFTSKTLVNGQWADADRRENFHACFLESVKRVLQPILSSHLATAAAPSTMTATAAAATTPSPRHASPIAAALTKALCFVKRWQETRADLADDSAGVRVLVLQASPDVDRHYQAVQNCIFAASSMKVTIDSCILPISNNGGLPPPPPHAHASSSSSSTSRSGGASSGLFLEQAAYRTNGVLVRADPNVDLRQHLVMAFLPSVADRAQLRMPGTTTVDLSANCFCHNKPVTETAWVCSVCLSIFCDPAAVCPACGTEISV